jgi:hypothetical protein
MQFKVRVPGTTLIFDGSYEIHPNGVLEIIREDNKPKVLMSPAFWQEIDESRRIIGGVSWD